MKIPLATREANTQRVVTWLSPHVIDCRVTSRLDSWNHFNRSGFHRDSNEAVDLASLGKQATLRSPSKLGRCESRPERVRSAAKRSLNEAFVVSTVGSPLNVCGKQNRHSRSAATPLRDGGVHYAVLSMSKPRTPHLFGNKRKNPYSTSPSICSVLMERIKSDNLTMGN